MEFVNGALLGWTALAAVPILVHLFHRPKPKEQPFPSLMFLRKCSRKSAAFAKLKNIVLMLLRAAAVAGIALAVARPRPAGAAPAADSGLAVAVVMDDSFRMGYREGGLSRFEEARRGALQVLGSLPTGVECALSFASGESTGLVPDPAILRSELLRASPSDQAAPVLPALVWGARSLEGARGKRREVHLFTDLARSGWTGIAPESLGCLKDTTLYIHDVGREAPVNATIQKIELTPRIPRVGRPLELAATVAGWGRTAPVTISLRVGEQTIESKTVTLSDGGTAVVKFMAVPEKGPVFHGSVSIATPDPLPADDIRYFAAPVNEPLRALVIEDEPDATLGAAPYLSYALSPPTFRQRSPASVAVAIPRDLPKQDLRKFDCIFIVSPGGIGREAAARLADFVAAGGGLTLFAGPRAGRDELAAFIAGDLYPPIKGVTETSARLAPPASEHPAFQSFRVGRNGDLTAPTFIRRLHLAGDGRWRPALLFDDGLPAALEAIAGRGRLLAFPFALASTWTDLPNFPCFVPMAHEVARHMGASEGVDHNFDAGNPVVYPLGRRPIELEYSLVHLRTGERESRRADPSITSLQVARALPAGNYLLEMSDGVRPFSVNLDPAGSDPTRLSKDEVAKMLPGVRFSFACVREGIPEVHEARQRREWTLPVLLLIAGVLLSELLLASTS